MYGRCAQCVDSETYMVLEASVGRVGVFRDSELGEGYQRRVVIMSDPIDRFLSKNEYRSLAYIKIDYSTF